MTATAEREPIRSAGPIECQPWCIYKDGHADAAFEQDQCCFSEQSRIDLTRHDPINEGEPCEPAWGPDYIKVDMRERPRNDPYFVLAHEVEVCGSQLVEWEFTYVEVQQLAAQLQGLLAKIDPRYLVV